MYVHTPSTCRTPHSYAVPVLSNWHQCTLCDTLPTWCDATPTLCDAPPTLCDAPPTLCDVPPTLCPPGVGWTSSECGSQCQALGWNSQHQVCASVCESVCVHACPCVPVGGCLSMRTVSGTVCNHNHDARCTNPYLSRNLNS